MKRLRALILGLALALTCSFGGALAVAVPASADTPVQTACEAVGSKTCADTSGGVSIQKIINVAINILSWVVGIAAVIMIIVSGFRYVTAGGDSNAVTSAKNTLMYAIIGLVIVALAQAIVQFVINKSS